jgi:hypothetical protein
MNNSIHIEQDILAYDKLSETYSMRIPEITKIKIDKLPAPFKRKLNHELLMTIARVLHEADFNPCNYLKTTE